MQPETVTATLDRMRAKLSRIVPDIELRAKAPLVHEINARKREQNAIILGHNYMEPVLFHMVTDVVGDSLELSRKAAEATADIIIFCGVRFMAETAKILNPSRKVLLPAKIAGCSLAGSITAADVRALKAAYPGVPVVTYINTYADVKAETDICCTSGNAAKIIASLPGDKVIFLPDEYLAKNIARDTGKKMIFPPVSTPHLDNRPSTLAVLNESSAAAGEVIGWHGKCEVHEQYTPGDVLAAREQYPDAVLLAHPECPPQVTELVDFSGSTSAMIKFVKESTANRFILFTECSMGDNIAADNPNKEMVRFCSIRCPHMNEITLEDTLLALTEGIQEINLAPEILARARLSLDRMLEFS